MAKRISEQQMIERIKKGTHYIFICSYDNDDFIKLRRELIVMIYIKNNQLMRTIYNLNDKKINSMVIL